MGCLFFFRLNDEVMVCATYPPKKLVSLALAFFHSCHAHLRVFAFLLNCFCTSELPSYSPSPSSWPSQTPKKRGRVRVRRTLLGGVRWQTTARLAGHAAACPQLAVDSCVCCCGTLIHRGRFILASFLEAHLTCAGSR